jgi:hypothetical protein
LRPKPGTRVLDGRWPVVGGGSGIDRDRLRRFARPARVVVTQVSEELPMLFEDLQNAVIMGPTKSRRAIALTLSRDRSQGGDASLLKQYVQRRERWGEGRFDQDLFVDLVSSVSPVPNTGQQADGLRTKVRFSQDWLVVGVANLRVAEQQPEALEQGADSVHRHFVVLLAGQWFDDGTEKLLILGFGNLRWSFCRDVLGQRAAGEWLQVEHEGVKVAAKREVFALKVQWATNQLQ